MGGEPMMVPVEMPCSQGCCCDGSGTMTALLPIVADSREARLMEAGLAAVRYTKAFDRWQVCVTPGGDVEREYRAAELAAERAARAVDPRAPDGEKEQG